MKQGQIWYLDMMIGVVIFVGTLIFFYQANINFLDQDENMIEDLDLEGRMLTDALMRPGLPEGWEPSSVLEIGISDDKRINGTKVAYLAAMDYGAARSLLRTKYDFYLFFETNDGPIPLNSTHEGLGKPGANSTNIVDEFSPNHLIKMTRFVAYQSNAARMVVYLWR